MFDQFSPPETNFLERLRYWAVAIPDNIAYRFLDKDEEDFESVTFAQLDRQAKAIAAKLVSMGMRGERALLMYPPGLESRRFSDVTTRVLFLFLPTRRAAIEI